jgi:hypothetical protein
LTRALQIVTLFYKGLPQGATISLGNSLGGLELKWPGEEKMTRLSDTTANFIYYKDDGLFVGWLEEYPDYRTQGETLDELKEHLKDVYEDINAGKIPNVRKCGKLPVG